MNYRKDFFGLLLTILLLGNITSYAGGNLPELSWPLEIESDNGIVITLYQPQLESFEANMLEGRMAITIKPKAKK